MNIMTTYTRLVTWGIALGITLAVATELHHPAFAARDPIEPF